jgi:transposase
VVSVATQVPEPIDKDALIAQLQAENRQQKAQLELLKQELKEQKEKTDALIRRIFGAKSEQLDPAQLELLPSQGTEVGKTEASVALVTEANRSAKRPSRKANRRRERWPEDLPLEREYIDPEEVAAQPESFRCIGEELSEKLDYQPARFFRRQLIRRKYVARFEPELAPIIAPLPETLQQRCVAAPGLLAQIIVSKYCHHLPLYRQEQIYWSQAKVWLPRASQARWLALCSYWLAPVYEAIKAEVFASGYLQIDETPIRYLKPGAGRAAFGYLWVVNHPGGEVFFDWQTSRAGQCLETLIPKDFNGTIQSDGYSAYGAFARQRLGSDHPVTLAGCWAHTRRGFFEAKDQAPLQALWILRQIQHLYEVEAQLRDQKLGLNLRLAYRLSRSQPILDRLHRICLYWERKRRFLPQSAMGKAIHYLLRHWLGLCRYLTDPQLEIDNNLVENAIRPTAVGKKNWLFFGDAEAGEHSAIFYTLVASCHRHQIDPFTYFRDILTRLPYMTNWQIKDITPRMWAEQRHHTRHAA